MQGIVLWGVLVLVLFGELVGSIRFLFNFPRIVFILCLLCFFFCFVFGGRTHILTEGLGVPYHFRSLFFLDIHASTPPTRHTHPQKQTCRQMRRLVGVSCVHTFIFWEL